MQTFSKTVTTEIYVMMPTYDNAQTDSCVHGEIMKMSMCRGRHHMISAHQPPLPTAYQCISAKTLHQPRYLQCCLGGSSGNSSIRAVYFFGGAQPPGMPSDSLPEFSVGCASARDHGPPLLISPIRNTTETQLLSRCRVNTLSLALHIAHFWMHRPQIITPENQHDSAIVFVAKHGACAG